MVEIDGIRRLLPHGHPMLLVDRIVELEPRRAIVATKAITYGEPCYASLPAGAGAHAYTYPASLLLESFGQAAALLWMAGRGDGDLPDAGLPGDADGDGRVLMLATARDCTVDGRALPGDVIEHRARIDHVVGDNVFVSGESFVWRRRIASVGSMMAVIRPRRELATKPTKE